MLSNHPQPRWFMLYLALPLAGVLLWAIRRGQPPGAVRSLLEIGALLAVFTYVEAWHLANRGALLHHPLTGDDRGPIYYVSNVAGSRPAQPESRIQAVFVTGAGAYDDLFCMPVYVGEPTPSVLQVADAAPAVSP